MVLTARGDRGQSDCQGDLSMPTLILAVLILIGGNLMPSRADPNAGPLGPVQPEQSAVTCSVDGCSVAYTPPVTECPAGMFCL